MSKLFQIFELSESVFKKPVLVSLVTHRDSFTCPCHWQTKKKSLTYDESNAKKIITKWLTESVKQPCKKKQESNVKHLLK